MFHNEVQTLLGVYSLVEFDDIGVADPLHDRDLPGHRPLSALTCEDFVFIVDFHGAFIISPLIVSGMDYSICSFSQFLSEHEI